MSDGNKVVRNVKAWLQALDEGLFDKPEDLPSWSCRFQEECFKRSCDAGWYDWFCKDSALPGRTRRYGSLVRGLLKVNPAIGDAYTVGFAQSAPLFHNGYNDCLHIYRIDDDDKGWGIYIDNPGRDHKYEVFRYGTAQGTDFQCDSAWELRRWFAQEVA